METMVHSMKIQKYKNSTNGPQFCHLEVPLLKANNITCSHSIRQKLWVFYYVLHIPYSATF